MDGVELTLVDTAGLRAGGDVIEREGMRRAAAELERADLAIVVLDARDLAAGTAAVADAAAAAPLRLWLLNKCDLLEPAALAALPAVIDDAPALAVSAHSGQGFADVHARLAVLTGAGEAVEGAFSARQRQVDALRRAQAALVEASAELDIDRLELAAEALRAGHDALGEITGRVAPDDLLGHIFSTFCIGK